MHCFIQSFPQTPIQCCAIQLLVRFSKLPQMYIYYMVHSITAPSRSPSMSPSIIVPIPPPLCCFFDLERPE
jgi:hypothetical protein